MNSSLDRKRNARREKTRAGPRALRACLFRLVASDVRAKARWLYQVDNVANVLKVLLTDGTAAMIIYRLMQWARRWRLTPLEMIFNRFNSIFCNCIIGRGAEFGPGFVLIHSTGVVINGSVQGGSNIHIEHQVTIGAERRSSPVLRNDIFIGAGAKIIGPVTVGDGARIGANAVVVRDVPAHSTVAGIPARVVRMRSPHGPDISVAGLKATTDKEGPVPAKAEIVETSGNEVANTSRGDTASSEDFVTVEDAK